MEEIISHISAEGLLSKEIQTNKKKNNQVKNGQMTWTFFKRKHINDLNIQEKYIQHQ